MIARHTKAAPLLLASGACALVYQVVWLRELRVIFGASTPASAAVLAIFIGGLGAGGLLLGRRVEAHPSPLALYAHLEAGVAVTAAVSPLLIGLVRAVYLALGGSPALGLFASTLLRLALSALVLLPPTLLMGGTLPALARAVVGEGDERRRGFAVLYAVNTAGAVLGASLTTFVLIEAMGVRGSLYLAALCNVAVALVAKAWSIAAADTPALPPAHRAGGPSAEASAPPRFVLGATLLVGLVFFLMELVWYRMLGPLLGGSVFTFGLILTVALLGLGIGGALYALLGEDRPATLQGFAATCLLEAFFIALPYALGDGVAVLSLAMRQLGAYGFAGHVVGWSVVAAVVILPPSIVSGAQFPLLIGLLGRGRAEVGRQTGLAYAYNTVGAIAGSLLGGFVLLPWLTAPGCWLLCAGALLLLGLVALGLRVQRGAHWLELVAPAGLSLSTVALMTLAEGPTAVWRHSPIGAGRVSPEAMRTPQARKGSFNATRHAVRRQREGRESSVGLDTSSGLAFVVSGKVDGNSIYDGPTVVMHGLLGAVLHPQPKSALVIGLGTGSTAGWLAAHPTIAQVDVAELEPFLLEVARECAPVNHDAMGNPKLKVHIGDAREIATVASKLRYSLIASEPSNPYRAGVASLFTRDFYLSVDKKLEPNGLFLQWLQAYEVDALTIRTIIATVRSVFGYVEVWQLREGDLMLVAAREPLVHDVTAMRARIEQEPLKSALRDTWRVTSLEGVLGHFVARSTFADAIAKQEGSRINTDDRPIVEFGFARGISMSTRAVSVDDVFAASFARGEHRPPLTGGTVDWEEVDDARLAIPTGEAFAPALSSRLSADRWQRGMAQRNYIEGQLKAASDAWHAQPKSPTQPVEIEVVAAALADAGEEGALPYIEQLRALHRGDAEGVLAWLRYRQGRYAEAAAALVAAFEEHRRDPFVSAVVLQRALSLVTEVATVDKSTVAALDEALSRPFALYALNNQRELTRVQLAKLGDFKKLCVAALSAFEPHPVWTLDHLTLKKRCHDETGAPLLARATSELEELMRTEPPSVIEAR